MPVFLKYIYFLMLWITRIKAWLFERVFSLCLFASASVSVSLSFSSVSVFMCVGMSERERGLYMASSWPQGGRARLNVWVSVFLASSKQNKNQNANLHAHQKQCFNMKTDGTVTQFNLRMLTCSHFCCRMCVYIHLQFQNKVCAF